MSAFQNYFLDTFKYRYADFEGRARRSEYWYFILFTYLTMFAFLLIMIPLVSIEQESISTFGYVPIILIMVFSLACVIPSLALTVRRLHDTGKSGWWYLIAFIPFGSLVLIVFMFLEGEPHTNKWGPDPKDPNLNDTVTKHLLEDDIV